MAVHEVTAPDVNAALWFDAELRPRIEARPQQQLERDRSQAPRAAQGSANAPRVGPAAPGPLEVQATRDLDPFAACALSPPIGERVEQAGAQRDHAAERGGV